MTQYLVECKTEAFHLVVSLCLVIGGDYAPPSVLDLAAKELEWRMVAVVC